MDSAERRRKCSGDKAVNCCQAGFHLPVSQLPHDLAPAQEAVPRAGLCANPALLLAHAHSSSQLNLSTNRCCRWVRCCCVLLRRLGCCIPPCSPFRCSHCCCPNTLSLCPACCCKLPRCSVQMHTCRAAPVPEACVRSQLPHHPLEVVTDPRLAYAVSLCPRLQECDPGLAPALRRGSGGGGGGRGCAAGSGMQVVQQHQRQALQTAGGRLKVRPWAIR